MLALATLFFFPAMSVRVPLAAHFLLVCYQKWSDSEPLLAKSADSGWNCGDPALRLPPQRGTVPTMSVGTYHTLIVICLPAAVILGIYPNIEEEAKGSSNHKGRNSGSSSYRFKSNDRTSGDAAPVSRCLDSLGQESHDQRQQRVGPPGWTGPGTAATSPSGAPGPMAISGAKY